MRRVWRIVLGTIAIATLPAVASSADGQSARVAPCSRTAVAITTYMANVAAGSVDELYWIRNVSDQRCSLRGFVHVVYIGTYSPRPVMKAHRLVIVERDSYGTGGVYGGLHHGLAVPMVVLPPRTGVASFWISGTDEQFHQANGRASRCIMSFTMRVWLPGATAALTAVPQRAGTFFWCGSITIMPILAGRSGSDPAHPLSYFFGNPSP
jgi:hypothetical protein